MLIFDIETDGLVHDVSSIHCAVIYDTEDDQYHHYNDAGTKDPIVRAITRLEEADCIVGHNIINYDLRVIAKLYPFFSPVGTVIDTLLLSRLYHPNLMEVDKKQAWKHMPLQLYGRHSLEAYGYRLGEYKGNFAKTTDWSDWSQEMEDYCAQDVKVTNKLCDHFQPYLNGSR